MDFTSVIQIIVAIAVIYLLIKFIVNPIIKIAVGILLILGLIYVLQRYFNFNIDKILSPLGISVNVDKWDQSFSWILTPANYYLDQVKNFIDFIWGNFIKSGSIKTIKP
jgi:hypothetical protein